MNWRATRSTRSRYPRVAAVRADSSEGGAKPATCLCCNRQYNRKTGNRLKQNLVDSVSGEPVDTADRVKGYQVAKGQYGEKKVPAEMLDIAQEIIGRMSGHASPPEA